MGSGSLITVLLLLLRSFPPKVNVGTDIAHTVVLTSVTGFLHFQLGNVDPGFGSLAAGGFDSGWSAPDRTPLRVSPCSGRAAFCAGPC